MYIKVYKCINGDCPEILKYFFVTNENINYNLRISNLLTLPKKLSTIKTDVPIEIDLETIRIKDSDSVNLIKLLDDLEFRTIKNRMISQGIINEKKNEQLSFFDSGIKN